MYWKIYALFLICFGILNPIINYNTKYECLPYGQDFITSNAICLTITLVHNTFLYPLILLGFNNIKFSQWLDINIIFSIILTLLIMCSNQQFI
jgi:hypothetical protein